MGPTPLLLSHPHPVASYRTAAAAAERSLTPVHPDPRRPSTSSSTPACASTPPLRQAREFGPRGGTSGPRIGTSGVAISAGAVRRLPTIVPSSISSMSSHFSSLSLRNCRMPWHSEQVRALERCFETDNKMDPDGKARIARDLALQPRQVVVRFQNRRARWKTKTLERDFAALRARHDALRGSTPTATRCTATRTHSIRELRQKLQSKAQEAAVKLEAAATGNDTAEERQTTAGAPPARVCKDGSLDSGSSVVFNDVEASPYSGAAFEQPAFVGFGAPPFLDTTVTAPTAGCSPSPPMFETKWQHGPTYPFDSYKTCAGGYGFTEE